MGDQRRTWTFGSEDALSTATHQKELSFTLSLCEAESWEYVGEGGDWQAWIRGHAIEMREGGSQDTEGDQAKTTGTLVDGQDQTDQVGSFLSGFELMNALKLNRMVDSFEHQESQLTGHYGLVVKSKTEVILYADRLRSFPLFYSLAGRRLWISDDLLWLRDQLGGEWQSHAALSLLRSAQLVAGRDTLWKGIYQLRAGEVLSWDGQRLNHVHRELYVHEEDQTMSEEALHSRLASVTERITERLISFADGALIVVPLSGGFDSRLVLAGLVAAGYPRLLAFTYGQSMGAEVRMSRDVAAALGVAWHFVEVSAEMWQRWPTSTHGKGVIARARRSGVLYHVQDPIAVEQLVSKGLIPPGSVVACGHSGDLHAGSVIDAKSMNIPLNEEGLVDLIVSKYFRFNAAEKLPERSDLVDEMLKELVTEQLSTRFRQHAIENEVTRELVIDELERWVWRERISKFLIQSMRCYEEHGLRWWLPLWDRDFTDLWLNVPLHLRGRDSAYRRFVDHYYQKVSGQAPRGATVRASQAQRIPLLKRVLLRSKLVQTMRLRARSPMGWYALLPLVTHWRSRIPEDHINAHLIRSELDWWRHHFEE